MMIFDPIDCGSARSRASRLTGRTSNEYVVAMRSPLIRAVKVRPRRVTDGLLVDVGAAVDTIRADSSSQSSIT